MEINPKMANFDELGIQQRAELPLPTTPSTTRAQRMSGRPPTYAGSSSSLSLNNLLVESLALLHYQLQPRYRRRRDRPPPLTNRNLQIPCNETNETFNNVLPREEGERGTHLPSPSPSFRKGSGKRLSIRHDLPSLKHHGKTLKGGMPALTSRLQTL